MTEDIRSKIHRLVNAIEDESILQMVAEDITYYTAGKDIVDDLDTNQQQELDEAIQEVGNKETINWNDFLNEMNGWKEK